jgi:hypothetical protein
VRRRQHQLEARGLLGRQIELSVGADVGLDAADHPERPS